MDECKPLVRGRPARFMGASLGRDVQVDNIKPRVESAYGVCNQRLQLQYDEPLLNFAFNLNLRLSSWALVALTLLFACISCYGFVAIFITPKVRDFIRMKLHDVAPEVLIDVLHWLRKGRHNPDECLDWLRRIARVGSKYCHNDGCEVVGHLKEFKVCPQCKTARYCGDVCQRQDWTTGGHKAKCCTIRMMWSSTC